MQETSLLPEKVQGPTDGIADHVRHEAAVKSWVRALILYDVSDYAHRVTDVTCRALVHCAGPVLARRLDIRAMSERHTLQACLDDVEGMDDEGRDDARAKAGETLDERRRKSGICLSSLDRGIHPWHG